jgi:16S rRNA (cytosine1402-N4)-methyltransferase
MDKESELTASDIINNWKEADLIRIFKEYSQERYARKIAKAIVKEREKEPIFRTLQLVEIINKTKPRTREKIHPATKIFQALRIAVNNELENLKKVLPDCLEILKSKGKIAVISFHSKEDAIVKKFFAREAKDCICPIKQPICTCGHKAQLTILTKKPIVPKDEEIKQNPQSRSAKLRVAQKI